MSNEKRNKKRMKKFAYHFKSVFLIACSGWFLFYAVNELSTTRNIQKDIKEAEIQAAKINEETENLQKQKEMLQDPNYAMNYARGKLLISQDGEQIFSLDENK